MEHLNNYEYYIQVKLIVDNAIKSLKFELKSHENYLVVNRPKSFDLTQTGILYLSLKLTAKALLNALEELGVEVSNRFEEDLIP